LITDHDDVLDQAIQAAQDAVKQQLPGFLGLHLEGPHLSADKKGAHDASLMRPMSDDDLARLLTAREALPVLMITVAPELVRPEQIRTLSEAGIIVSLGHSNCSYKQAALAIEAGASAITHLYNAMSPLQHRDPGLVGAALHHDETYVSLIADGHHVDSVALSIVLKSRGKHPTACLITDAMSTVGTPMKTLTLNGRTIFRDKGVLRLEDGTLAGADIDMHSAVRHIHNQTNLDWYDAVKLASRNPAHCLKQQHDHGSLVPGSAANVVHMSEQHRIEGVWINGRRTPA